MAEDAAEPSSDRAGAEVRQAQERALVELVADDRRRLEFLLELHHELRTPAGLIRGLLELAADGDLSAEDAVATARSQAEVLCEKLDEIMLLAHQELDPSQPHARRTRSAYLTSRELRKQTDALLERAHELINRSRAREARSRAQPGRS